MATVPSFITWTAGAVMTAANLNSNVRDAGNFFLSVPICECRQTVAQSLATGSVTPLTFDTEDVDTDNGHSTVTNTSRYTGQTSGRFQFSGQFSTVANATGRRLCLWTKNGTTLNSSQSSEMAVTTGGVGTDHVPRTITVVLNGTTDYVELNGLQESGGALNTNTVSAAQSGMSVRWVGTT